MAIPNNINPQYVLDKSIQEEIERLQQTGEIAVQTWNKAARPASGWTAESYWNATQAHQADTPEFPGAQSRATSPGGWMEQASRLIGSAEGLEAYAYHGLRSSFRKTQGVRVKDGHGSKEEVSVGFGFNMTRGPDARAAFKAVGLDDQAFDDVLNGRRKLSTAHATQLRDNDILTMNAGINRAVGGRPLRDHQRAALVSLAYNTGFGGAMPVLNAVRDGHSEKDVAAFIARFKVGTDGKLANRRKHEASLWLGAQAEDFFKTHIDANQLGAAEVNPRDRR